jgi:outer membrane receptor protein involved in Fe transport
MGRIDEHIGTRDFIFFRYSGWQETNTGASSVPRLFSITELPTQQYGVSWMHVFNPSLTMQVQYGRTHVEYNSLTQFNFAGASTYGLNPASWSFFGGISLLPSLTLSSPYFGGGEVNSPSPNESSIHEWKGSVTKTIGRHTFQAGGGWDEINYAELIRQGALDYNGVGTENFVGNPGSTVGLTTAGSQSGNALADFLLNMPELVTKRNVNVTEKPGGIGSVYLQDSWKATSKLTANIGLRYDRTDIPQYGTNAAIGENGSPEMGIWDFTTGQYIMQLLPPTCAVRGYAPCLPSPYTATNLPPYVVVSLHGKILHGTKTNFGPRLGLAYQVNSTLVVRAGFGIVYDNWAASTQLPQNPQGELAGRRHAGNRRPQPAGVNLYLNAECIWRRRSSAGI